MQESHFSQLQNGKHLVEQPNLKLSGNIFTELHNHSSPLRTCMCNTPPPPPPTQPPPTWPRVPLGNLDPRRLSGGTSPTVVTAPPPLKHLFRKRTLIFCDFTFGPSSVIRCGPARTPRPQVSAPKGVWEEPRWSAKFVWSSVFVRFKSVTPYFAMVC